MLHFKNFDPNTHIYQSYAHDVDKIELPGLLMELSKKYFMQLGHIEGKAIETTKGAEQLARNVYQCTSCLTIYDEVYGDIKSGVKTGTLFKDLSDDFLCPVCESPKTNFINVELQLS